MNKPIRIGSLSASIDGDSRYTDTITVYVNADDSVSIEVTESTADGGMDGPGGFAPGRLQSHHYPATTTAKDILKGIKKITSSDVYNFKKYGKPSKRFNWIATTSNYGAFGLNLQLLQDALGLGRAK